MTYEHERQEHAAHVLAFALQPDAGTEPSTGWSCLRAALHHLLIHEKYRGLRQPDLGEPRAAAFEQLRAAALQLGEQLRATWDGRHYAWAQYADLLLRRLETIYSYEVTETP